jgi:Cof subfamily protein (haloacid dehalogenase superfamily)
MKHKLIASDLDGTLLTPAHCVSERTKSVIQTLVSQGFPFVIATGRHFLDVNDIRQALEVDMYLITANGARVHDSQGNMIYQQNIDPLMVKALLKPEFTAGTVLNMYRDEGWFIDQPLSWLLDMHQTSGFQYQLFHPPHDPGTGVSKVFYIADHAVLLRLKDRLESYFGQDTLAITFSIPDCLEVMHQAVSKGEALRQVAKLQGLSLADCLAFGDGLNDYELLSMAGKGLIMGNAHDALKACLPEQEVIGCNAEDAVAQYLVTHYQLPL